MSVNSSQSKEPVHTYKDDIIYQTVKGNHRRTSFVSVDHQIVNMGADTIRHIEKSEKLVTSDLRRSQTALLNKLERLQKKQETINSGNSSETDKGLTQRRFSAPFVNFNRLQSPTRKLRKENSTGSPRTKRGSEGEDGTLDTSHDISDFPSPRRERSIVHARSGTVSPDMKEARRLSFVAQEETSRKALQKLDALVAEHKRRATIATGATFSFGLVPSASDIARLTEIANRSISNSIEEEDKESSLDNSLKDDDATNRH